MMGGRVEKAIILIAQILYLHHLKTQTHSVENVARIRSLEAMIERKLGLVLPGEGGQIIK